MSAAARPTGAATETEVIRQWSYNGPEDRGSSQHHAAGAHRFARTQGLTSVLATMDPWDR